jgi:DNA repair protein REV1
MSNDEKYSTPRDSTWDGLNDSEINLALNENEKESKKENLIVNIDTDIDTDEDKHTTTNQIDTNKLVKSSFKDFGSDGWGSMNDSQFISFVNKISQSKHQLYPNSSIPVEPENSKINENENEGSNISEIQNETGNETGKEYGSELISQSPINILSSPVLLAQNNRILNDGIYDQEDDNEEYIFDDDPDKLMEEELKDSDQYAFSDYGEYFHAKNLKQQQQGIELSKFLKENNESKAEFPPIFSNCAIHVNGRTDPDILQLRKLIVLYGGRYVHYLSSKGSVTHIVAESLPPRKRVQFGNCKVVSPKWIVDSIAMGKLLNWADYRLEQLGDYGQKLINFKRKTVTSQEGEINKKNDNIKEENNQLNEKGDYKVDEDEITKATTLDDDKDNLLSQELKRLGIDAKSPDFLPIFFSKSRLHHLSTWKSELRSEFLTKAVTILKQKPKQNHNEKIILHVDFDCFFATVSAKLNIPPLDINKIPCCVTHGGNSADIASCNYVARNFGVKNGMWLSSAKKLCPNIVTLPYKFDEYEKISKRFYNYLLHLDIDSILPVSIDEALVDISSLCKNGNVYEIVTKIKNDLDKITNCTVSCGAGKNVLLAKLALRKAKPNNAYYQSNDENKIWEFLNDIPVKNLPGFGDRLYDKLLTIIKPINNIITLKEVREIEKNKLTSIFGIKLGEKLFEYSRGIDTTSIDILAEPDKYLRKSINIDVNWGIRFDNDSEVENFLHRLSCELNKRLFHIDMTGSLLSLKLSVRHPEAPIQPPKYLGMGYCTFVSKSARLGISTREIGVLSSELKYLWRFLNVEPKELRGVGVSMNKLVKYEDSKLEIDNQMKLQFKKATSKTNENDYQNDLAKNSLKLEPDEPLLKSKYNSPSKRQQYHELETEAIDWDVFDNLPPDLQLEIKQELRRRKLQSSPKKQKKYKTENDIANLVSPKKKTPRQSTPKKNLILSPEKIKEQKENQLMFQGIHVSDEDKITEKLTRWMDFTFDDDHGVDEKDLNLFNDFMIKLISTNNILKYIRILEVLKFHLNMNKVKPGYFKWKLIFGNLQLLLDEQSFTNFEFTF